MLDLLRTFSTLALISGAVLVLLPEGSLRKTASLVLGLMLTLCWMEGLMQLIRFPEPSQFSASILAPTSLTLQDAESSAETFLAGNYRPEVTQPP